MAEDNDRVVRSVAWSELFPWLSLFRTFRLAIGFRVLVLSAAGVILMVLGWWLIATIFVGSDEDTAPGTWLKPYHDCPWLTSTELTPTHLPWRDVVEPGGSGAVRTLFSGDDPFFYSWRQLKYPFARLFDLLDTKSPWLGLLMFTLCGLWALFVWAFFGGAITRIVALRLARNERIGWGAALRHARTKWLAYVAAPAFPLIGVAFITAGLLVAGLIMRGGIFVFLFSFIWPLFLLAGLLMAILLLGLLFGWPLMWATVGVESTDSFDALSRSYAYVFQRPLHYLFYAVIVALLGILGWILVYYFTETVINLTYGGVAWGGGADRILGQIKTGNTEGLHGITKGGTAIIHFWVGCVRLLAVGFVYSFFWTGATAIYFLLRRDVDATEMDEIFLDEEEDEFTQGLPDVTTDEVGAPKVAGQTTGEKPPTDAPAGEQTAGNEPEGEHEEPSADLPEGSAGPEGESPENSPPRDQPPDA